MNNRGLSLVEVIAAVTVLLVALAGVSHLLVNAAQTNRRHDQLVEKTKLAGKLKDVISSREICKCLVSGQFNKSSMDLTDDSRIPLSELDLATCSGQGDLRLVDKTKDPNSSIFQMYISNFKKVSDQEIFADLVLESEKLSGAGGMGGSLPLILEFDEEFKFTSCQSIRSDVDNNTNRFMEQDEIYDAKIDTSRRWWDEDRACEVKSSVFSFLATVNYVSLNWSEFNTTANASQMDIPIYTYDYKYEDVINVLSYDSVLSSTNRHLAPAIFGEVPEPLKPYYQRFDALRPQQSGGYHFLPLAEFQKRMPKKEQEKFNLAWTNDPEATQIDMSVPAIKREDAEELVARNSGSFLGGQHGAQSPQLPIVREVRPHWYMGAKVSEGTSLPIVVMPKSVQRDARVLASQSPNEPTHDYYWLMKYAFCFNGSFILRERRWERKPLGSTTSSFTAPTRGP